MADKIIIEVDLEKGDTTGAMKGIQKDAGKAGKKSGKSFSKGFNSSMKKLLGTASKFAAIAGSIASALVFKESIQAASRQEDAINKLNSALQISGKFSEQASQDLQNYASSLQQVTKFGDEAILETQALIQSLGNLSKNELKDATKASLDLAAALGIDLTAAATLVGKAAAGEVGSFSRYGVSIKKAETNAKTFANALDALESKFGGAAEKQVNTFSGATTQLSNTFGDLLEEIGFIITKSPEFLKVIKATEKAFKNAQVHVKAFAKEFNFISDIIQPLQTFNNAMIAFVVTPIEFMMNVAKQAGLRVAESFAGMHASIGLVAGALAKLRKFLGLGGVEELETFALVASETYKIAAEKANQAYEDIFKFPFSDSLAEANASLAEGLTVTESIIENSANKVEKSTKKVGKALSKMTQDANKIINGQFAKTISGGIQNVIQSLSKGENAMQNFTNFLVGAFGDLAIQLGEFYIAKGLADLAMLSVSPAAQIATGAALVALGGIMKSFVGGGTTGAGGGDTANAGFSTEAPTSTDDVDAEERQIGTTINLTVEGSLVQQEELGAYIADITSESNQKNGNVVLNPKFA